VQSLDLERAVFLPDRPPVVAYTVAIRGHLKTVEPQSRCGHSADFADLHGSRREGCGKSSDASSASVSSAQSADFGSYISQLYSSVMFWNHGVVRGPYDAELRSSARGHCTVQEGF